jgi:hypothetical protein
LAAPPVSMRPMVSVTHLSIAEGPRSGCTKKSSARRLLETGRSARAHSRNPPCRPRHPAFKQTSLKADRYHRWVPMSKRYSHMRRTPSVHLHPKRTPPGALRCDGRLVGSLLHSHIKPVLSHARTEPCPTQPPGSSSLEFLQRAPCGASGRSVLARWI